MTSRFSSDTSINQMEFDKLKTFLINNNNVDQITLLNLINDNTDINVNKVAIHCAVEMLIMLCSFMKKLLNLRYLL